MKLSVFIEAELKFYKTGYFVPFFVIFEKGVNLIQKKNWDIIWAKLRIGRLVIKTDLSMNIELLISIFSPYIAIL